MLGFGPKKQEELAVYMAPGEFAQVLAVATAVQPRRVLEWGAGGSTRALLSHCPFIEQYVSVEHNRQWHAKVAEAIADPRLTLHLVEPDEPLELQTPSREQQIAWDARAEVEPALMRSYVHLPESLGQRFDLVLVDGRARNLCMPVGFSLLEHGGVLVLHDAQREAYHTAVNALGRAVFIEPWEQGQVCLVRKP